ncbi:MAG: DEAD/DEAH box helicase family protein [bacterium]|nr:DEAD/DEAH box helicase family protein [bacterium]
MVCGNQLYIGKKGIPPALMTRIIRLAAFQNPEFYRAQAMRLTTFGKPRVICCAEDFPEHIALPRGTRDELQPLLADHGISMNIEDHRYGGSPLAARFHGVLLPQQQACVDAVMKHDIGVVSAATAFGKTVVAASIIAKRAVNCLILVHRQQLLDQWRERLAAFLCLPIEQIGEVSGTKKKRTGILDVAVMQSVNRKGVVNDFVGEYGHVVVDECHHVSAFSFEQVMRQVKARYVLGLTATPTRRDGHHPIIIMQCGPIRFRVSAKEQAGIRPFAHVVMPRVTDFVVPDDAGNVAIQDIYARLAADLHRNDMIVADVKHALNAGRSPIVLTDRTAHAAYFAECCAKDGVCVLLFKGGMGRKQRRHLADELKSIPDDKPRLIVATGRYIGEGFDDARLDTLFLATPISWRGTLQQYAGRLHRNHANKREVQVYDYIDARVPVLLKMYQRRLKGYAAIGYAVRQDVASRFDIREP